MEYGHASIVKWLKTNFFSWKHVETCTIHSLDKRIARTLTQNYRPIIMLHHEYNKVILQSVRYWSVKLDNFRWTHYPHYGQTIWNDVKCQILCINQTRANFSYLNETFCLRCEKVFFSNCFRPCVWRVRVPHAPIRRAACASYISKYRKREQLLVNVVISIRECILTVS